MLEILESSNVSKVICLNMGSCIKQHNVFCPIAKGEHIGSECPDFVPIPEEDAFKVDWTIPDSPHRTFRRAGKDVMGCGWCGHNQPEG